MNRRLIIVLLITVFTLSGCGHEHHWIEADCEVPKTCSECGEVEGEALGHNWVEADCEEAKHCSRCGLIEGEPLGHEWIEADYEKPKTCSVCGTTEGERIKTFVEEYGINVNRKLGEEYIIRTLTSSVEPDQEVIKGKIIFDSIKEIEGDERYEAEEGYKWYILNFSGYFEKYEYPVVSQKGWNLHWGVTDAKTGIGFLDEDKSDDNDTEEDRVINIRGEDAKVITWNVNGVEDIFEIDNLDSGWRDGTRGREAYLYVECGVKVPSDYEDLVFYVMSGELADIKNRLIDYTDEENFLTISVKDFVE